jgi:hypothetical protein
MAEIKITTPDPYDGSSDKTEYFLHQCDVYFLGSPALSEHQCVTFMISYMNKGHALSWAEWMMGEVTHPDFVADWGMFKNNVRNSFSNLDWTVMACLKIKDVKQGHESMDDYIVQFEEYEGFTGFDDATLMESFKEGLTPSILSCCYGLETVPSTLTAWKEKSRLFYRNYIKQQQQQQHQWGQPQQQQQGCHQPQPGSSCQGAHGPMVPPSSLTLAPMVKTEATMGQTHHSKCYHCGSESHWACNCPQRNTGSHWGGKPQGSCQIRADDTSESHFEERVDEDEKGKGKVKEEKDQLPNSVEQTGIDRWMDMDKKNLADNLKGKGFWKVLALCHPMWQAYCVILVLLLIWMNAMFVCHHH